MDARIEIQYPEQTKTIEYLQNTIKILEEWLATSPSGLYSEKSRDLLQKIREYSEIIKKINDPELSSDNLIPLFKTFCAQNLHFHSNAGLVHFYWLQIEFALLCLQRPEFQINNFDIINVDDIFRLVRNFSNSTAILHPEIFSQLIDSLLVKCTVLKDTELVKLADLIIELYDRAATGKLLRNFMNENMVHDENFPSFIPPEKIKMILPWLHQALLMIVTHANYQTIPSLKDVASEKSSENSRYAYPFYFAARTCSREVFYYFYSNESIPDIVKRTAIEILKNNNHHDFLSALQGNASLSYQHTAIPLKTFSETARSNEWLIKAANAAVKNYESYFPDINCTPSNEERGLIFSCESILNDRTYKFSMNLKLLALYSMMENIGDLTINKIDTEKKSLKDYLQSLKKYFPQIKAAAENYAAENNQNLDYLKSALFEMMKRGFSSSTFSDFEKEILAQPIGEHFVKYHLR